MCQCSFANTVIFHHVHCVFISSEMLQALVLNTEWKMYIKWEMVHEMPSVEYTWLDVFIWQAEHGGFSLEIHSSFHFDFNMCRRYFPTQWCYIHGMTHIDKSEVVTWYWISTMAAFWLLCVHPWRWPITTDGGRGVAETPSRNYLVDPGGPCSVLVISGHAIGPDHPLRTTSKYSSFLTFPLVASSVLERETSLCLLMISVFADANHAVSSVAPFTNMI